MSEHWVSHRTVKSAERRLAGLLATFTGVCLLILTVLGVYAAVYRQFPDGPVVYGILAVMAITSLVGIVSGMGLMRGHPGALSRAWVWLVIGVLYLLMGLYLWIDARFSFLVPMVLAGVWCLLVAWVVAWAWRRSPIHLDVPPPPRD